MNVKETLNAGLEKTKEVCKKVKNWVSDKMYDTKIFVQTHPEEALTFGVMAIGGIGAIAKAAKKNRRIEEERELKEEYCYDRSMGHYYRLKRKLSNAEWLEIEKRRKNGGSLGEILQDMRVLK